MSDNKPNEALMLLRAAKENSSEAQLTNVKFSVGSEYMTITWHTSGQAKLGQATFGIITASAIFNAKFDGPSLFSMTIFDKSRNVNREVSFNYEYDKGRFRVQIPQNELDFSHEPITFGLMVNDVQRGHITMKVT